MNIIITLPTSLANLIYEGNKRIEVRKTWPKEFDLKKDVVYICEKGTGLVTGMFTIKAKGISNSPELVWKNYKDIICVKKEWFMKYLKDCNHINLWYIKQADKFDNPYSLQQVFGVNKAPQSYCYTNVGCFLNDDFKMEVETSHKKAVQ